MIQIITLTKDDINTRPIGCHFEIVVREDFRINFTPDALRELMEDARGFLNQQADVESPKSNDDPENLKQM